MGHRKSVAGVRDSVKLYLEKATVNGRFCKLEELISTHKSALKKKQGLF